MVKLELKTEWGEIIQVEISPDTFQELRLQKNEDVYVDPKRFAFGGDYTI